MGAPEATVPESVALELEPVLNVPSPPGLPQETKVRRVNKPKTDFIIPP